MAPWVSEGSCAASSCPTSVKRGYVGVTTVRALGLVVVVAPSCSAFYLSLGALTQLLVVCHEVGDDLRYQRPFGFERLSSSLLLEVYLGPASLMKSRLPFQLPFWAAFWAAF